MLEDLLHFHLVFTIGEVLIQLPGVLLVEDTILQDRNGGELVVAVDETIDELPRLRGGEEGIGSGGPENGELGRVAGLAVERGAERAEVLFAHRLRSLGFHDSHAEQLSRARLQLLLAQRAAGELEHHPVVVVGQGVKGDRHRIGGHQRWAVERLHLHPLRLGNLDDGAPMRPVLEAHAVLDDDRRLRRTNLGRWLFGRRLGLRLRRLLRRDHLRSVAGGEQENREEDAFHALVLNRVGDQRSFLKTWPPFITKRTCSRRPMSCNGSPSTATRSARRPGDTSPRFCDSPRSAAATVVALWIACMGVIPYRTMNPNSFASFSVQAKPPTSVPKEIRARLRSALAKACFSNSTIF